LRTAGDKRFEEMLPAGGGKDAFTHELDSAVLRKKAECAVHSFPDVPTGVHSEMAAVAVLPRDDPRDSLVLNSLFEATSLGELPRGTRVGSSSVRVRALLRALCPALEVVPRRG